MKNRYFALIIIAVISIISYFGCKDTVTGSEVDSVTIPSSGVSYSKYIQPVLNVHCTSCHSSSSASGGIMLTTWGLTTSNVTVVFPGYPDNSEIIWAVEAKAGYTMPPLGSSYKSLNSNQVNGLKVWIKEGAKNN
jgi:hypothetical protein